jgi:hypothetical protein
MTTISKTKRAGTKPLSAFGDTVFSNIGRDDGAFWTVRSEHPDNLERAQAVESVPSNQTWPVDALEGAARLPIPASSKAQVERKMT